MTLEIVVMDGDRTVMKDRIKILRLDEKILNRIQIPGFRNSQVKELCYSKSVVYRHLGLSYSIRALE